MAGCDSIIFMQELKRSFKGVWIPAEIWINTEITPMEKMILTEINSLDGDEHCFASNKHFSEMFGISTRQVSEHIGALASKKCIKVTPIGRNRRVILIEENLYQRWRKTSITDGGKLPTLPIDKHIGKQSRYAASAATIAEIQDLFKIVDPNWRRMFRRMNQKQAVDRMIAEHGREKIEAVIKFLPRNNGTPFAPKITNPIQLEEDWGKMQAFWAQEKQRSRKNEVVVA